MAAFATSLASASAEESIARRMAVAEGLVTHLTSLVLVDRDDVHNEGLPTTRKIDLPAPRTLMPARAAGPEAQALFPASRTREPTFAESAARLVRSARYSLPHSTLPLGDLLRKTAGSIDWTRQTNALAAETQGACLLTWRMPSDGWLGRTNSRTERRAWEWIRSGWLWPLWRRNALTACETRGESCDCSY